MPNQQSSFLLSLDAFRKVPSELTNASQHGAILTLVAYAAMSLLFVLEFYAYMKTDVLQTVELDKKHDESIIISFDVQMFELPCQYANVVAKDLAGKQELELKQIDINKEKTIGGTADYKGDMDYTLDNAHRKDGSSSHHDVLTGEHPELDADWDSTSDHFKHTDFDAVLRYHDFTMVNFYASWCVHCRRFAPEWKKTEEAADAMTFRDKNNRKVSAKLLRVNCVEFSHLCSSKGIRAYPTVRLFRRDMSFTQYRGPRSKDAILNFVNEFVSKEETAEQITQGTASEVVTHHSELHEGCHIHGELELRRVPAYLIIEADSKLDSLDPRMTNVSHKVNHLYIVGDRQSLRNFVKATSKLVYGDALKNVQPMQNAYFITHREHTAPQHFLDVVPTIFNDGQTVLYQSTVQSHIVDVPVTKVPQARFQYVFSPLSINVQQKSRPFYDFLTSVFAIIGGTYTFVSLVERTYDTVSKHFKREAGKLT